MVANDIEWLTVLSKRLCRRLPPGVDRNELLSDGYIAVAKLRQQYDARKGVPFHGFAHQRVVGAMIDGLRQRQSRERSNNRCDRQVEPDHLPRLNVKLGRLRPRDRLVMQLHYLEQLDFWAVAKIFGCTPARISQLHHRALHELRKA